MQLEEIINQMLIFPNSFSLFNLVLYYLWSNPNIIVIKMINRKSPVLSILRIEKMSAHGLTMRGCFTMRRFWQDTAKIFRSRGGAIIVRVRAQNVMIMGAIVIFVAFVAVLVFDAALFRHVSLIVGVFAADEAQIRPSKIVRKLIKAILSSWPDPNIIFYCRKKLLVFQCPRVEKFSTKRAAVSKSIEIFQLWSGFAEAWKRWRC